MPLSAPLTRPAGSTWATCDRPTASRALAEVRCHPRGHLLASIYRGPGGELRIRYDARAMLDPVTLKPIASRADLAALKAWGRAGFRHGPFGRVLTGRYRCTGPEARTISSKAAGGFFWVHLPCDRAATARMSRWYLPWPLIPAYLPVPLTSV